MEGRPQYGTRRDANQAEICEDLRRLGFAVFDVSGQADLGFDLLVCGYHRGAYRPVGLAVEVKTACGRLTRREREVREDLVGRFGEGAPIMVARMTEDVVGWFEAVAARTEVLTTMGGEGEGLAMGGEGEGLAMGGEGEAVGS